MRPPRETSARLHCTAPGAHLWFQPHLRLRATHRPLVQSRPEPFRCPREAGAARGETGCVCAPAVCASAVLLHAVAVRSSSVSTPGRGFLTLLPAALSPQPTAVPSAGLFLNPVVPAPVCTSRQCLRLGHAGLWHRPAAQVSLCPACHSLAAALSSKPQSAPLSQRVSPPAGGHPRCGGLSCLQFPTQVCRHLPYPDSVSEVFC